MLVALVAACDDGNELNVRDAGVYKKVGDACDPDTPPTSECGYMPQFYCSASGVCASACNSDSDCVDSMCIGASSGVVGTCVVSSQLDGGS